eukprot:351134-Chlamydomonas_euryale.AAC.6
MDSCNTRPGRDTCAPPAAVSARCMLPDMPLAPASKWPSAMPDARLPDAAIAWATPGSFSAPLRLLVATVARLDRASVKAGWLNSGRALPRRW